MTEVDLKEKYIRLNVSVIAFDYLVISAGARTNFFGFDTLEEHGLQLKDLDTAVKTRNHLLSTADFENIESAEAWMDLPDMIDFIDWQIHFFDFAILSALQVDRHGNINTVLVGEPAKPRVRGPGTVGISALCGLARRFYVVLTRHNRSAFRPRVDFICGAAHLEDGGLLPAHQV